MTTSPLSPSSSGAGSPSSPSAFERLHPKVQKWIWDQGWNELRPVQEQSIPAILDGELDVLLAAATAGGKTEAAFLPIASMLASNESRGLRVLCISPLKALINDQFGRLEALFEYLDVPVHRWHGDVSSDRKRKLLKDPEGVLLITPESLEALFVIHGYRIATILAGLERVVIDEAHVFIGSDRGKQLQSLLARLEQRLQRRIPRIGLSATLGDLAVAAEYLRPGHADQVAHIVSGSAGQELRMQVRGYEAKVAPTSGPETSEPVPPSAALEIAGDLWRALRGGKHLAFANRRATVERISDILRRRSEAERVPNEFYPHHGSLSKEFREEAESKLKDPTTPATAVCTSTLELGIDIGQVESVAQIDAPFSVASIRQRLGRSGRRGGPAILRMYIEEPPLSAKSPLLDELRPEIVQTVAMVQLLVERWCEPNDPGGLNLSTLTQQALSLIAERGGVTAEVAWTVLCERGAFRSLSKQQFVALLRCLGQQELILQGQDGTLYLAEKGERIVEHFTFFAVFSTPEEFRLVCAGKTLGTLTVDTSITRDLLLVFAGRCWRVLEVDPEALVITVEPAPGGRLPHFEGGRGGLIHDEIRRRMREVWLAGDLPPYLDPNARRLLVEGRSCFVRRGLESDPIQADGRDAVFMLCRGDRITNTVTVMLSARGHSVMNLGPMVSVRDMTPAVLRTELSQLTDSIPDAVDLAHRVRNKLTAKYDWVLDENLLSADYASRALAPSEAVDAIRSALDLA